METLPISSELIEELEQNDNGSLQETVKLKCATGQTLIADRHLMPGWLCSGTYENLVTHKIEDCKTYNNLRRTVCKWCRQARDITQQEFETFLSMLKL